MKDTLTLHYIVLRDAAVFNPETEKNDLFTTREMHKAIRAGKKYSKLDGRLYVHVSENYTTQMTVAGIVAGMKKVPESVDISDLLGIDSMKNIPLQSKRLGETELLKEVVEWNYNNPFDCEMKHNLQTLIRKTFSHGFEDINDDRDIIHLVVTYSPLLEMSYVRMFHSDSDAMPNSAIKPAEGFHISIDVKRPTKNGSGMYKLYDNANVRFKTDPIVKVPKESVCYAWFVC
jgi:hypothetical protein